MPLHVFSCPLEMLSPPHGSRPEIELDFLPIFYHPGKAHLENSVMSTEISRYIFHRDWVSGLHHSLSPFTLQLFRSLSNAECGVRSAEWDEKRRRGDTVMGR